ncbi:MAG: hypothetical protein O3A00_05225 [Planctomycetota bacterium]|nr:hypothetical protein [Planctomycetota bacterium]
MAMTDKDIDKLADSRELKNVETVNWKNMEPIKGGLFDQSLTGGHGGGNRWSYIKLHEPLPNPVMEEPIRRVLGLTTNNFKDVISRKHDINGVTCPRAISQALDALDLDKEIARERAKIQSSEKTAREATRPPRNQERQMPICFLGSTREMLGGQSMPTSPRSDNRPRERRTRMGRPRRPSGPPSQKLAVPRHESSVSAIAIAC